MKLKSLLRHVLPSSKAKSPPPPWDEIAAAAINKGVIFEKEVGSGYTLASYRKDGKLDYETYRQIQEVGNRGKINRIFTTEALISLVANHAKDRLGVVNRILCHGTRNGAEQRWFQSHFPKAEILGTEISETATQFPMTILWDFHEIRDGWIEHWDILYSNSWDHSFYPPKMFSAWSRTLRSGGILYLEHTPEHEVVDHLDLFGATPDALRGIVEASGLTYMETLEYPKSDKDRRVLVFHKR
jgi:hypothetical protein